jgi:ribosomal protein S12 methylthiotransferase accessory factor
VSPEFTWERVYPLCERFGITRVAEITGLDEIGLPVAIAYRPVGSTYAVSIGTGLRLVEARVSAIMESIEVWHAENPICTSEFRAASRDLALHYDPRTLNLAPRSPLTAATVLDWVTGYGVLTGSAHLVPFDTVTLDFTRPDGWGRRLFNTTSNGLASGNNTEEAVLHALLELIERDCITDHSLSSPGDRRYVDPSTIRDPDARAVYTALRGAGCRIILCDITNRVGIPCYAAEIWSSDVPIRSGGFGCHVEADLAAGRALAEAAQSRLGVVSGARDDIDANAYQPGRPLIEPVRGTADSLTERSVPAWMQNADLATVVHHCAERIAAVTGVEPFTLDLTHPDIGVAVCKAYAPGLRLFEHEAIENSSGDPQGRR